MADANPWTLPDVTASAPDPVAWQPPPRSSDDYIASLERRMQQSKREAGSRRAARISDDAQFQVVCDTEGEAAAAPDAAGVANDDYRPMLPANGVTGCGCWRRWRCGCLHGYWRSSWGGRRRDEEPSLAEQELQPAAEESTRVGTATRGADS